MKGSDPVDMEKGPVEEQLWFFIRHYYACFSMTQPK